MDVVAAVAAPPVAHPRPRIAARAHARQRDRAIRARVAATARIARAARARKFDFDFILTPLLTRLFQSRTPLTILKKLEENNQN